jgi:hypothetical protein
LSRWANTFVAVLDRANNRICIDGGDLASIAPLASDRTHRDLTFAGIV